MKLAMLIVVAIVLVVGVNTTVTEGQESADGSTPPSPLIYINSTFENASPLFWEIGDLGEIIRVGCHDAPHRVLIRARAHPWEPGGNWVVQGMIRRLLKGDKKAGAYLDRYCVYVMPMANKDGVARGRTRFVSQWEVLAALRRAVMRGFLQTVRCQVT